MIYYVWQLHVEKFQELHQLTLAKQRRRKPARSVKLLPKLTEILLTLFSIRNPNLYLNGSWTKQYWPVRSRYQKEYLNLRAGNLSVGKGYNARKCAFWDSYLPSILGKRGNYERQTL